jgi:glycosyltransferase involved in cell wall biosynthesis
MRVNKRSMGERMRVDVIIPALDESRSIADVVKSIPRPPVRTVLVVDNGSRDQTAEAARAAGAIVISEARRGYGSACLAGLSELRPLETDIVVFLDGDGSDDAAAIPKLVAPIEDGDADLVVGTRISDRCALPVQQRLGNAIAAWWLRTRFDLPATDLGPFRAVRRLSLDELCMSDRGYGWTVEMQIKAARRGLRYLEIAVPYSPRRHGASKISGTLRGTIGAATKILGLLAAYDLRGARQG